MDDTTADDSTGSSSIIWHQLNAISLKCNNTDVNKTEKITGLWQAFANSLTLASSGIKENVFPNNIVVRSVVHNNIIVIFYGTGELLC